MAESLVQASFRSTSLHDPQALLLVLLLMTILMVISCLADASHEQY